MFPKITYNSSLLALFPGVIALSVGILFTVVILTSLLGLGQPYGHMTVVPDPYIFLGIFDCFFILIPLWMITVRVTLNYKSLYYFSIFSRKDILYTSISHIKAEWKYGRSKRFAISFYDQSGTKLLTLYAPRPFAQPDLVEIVTKVMDKNHQIELEDTTGIIRPVKPERYTWMA